MARLKKKIAPPSRLPSLRPRRGMRRLVFLARWFVVGCRRGDRARGGRAGRGLGSAAHLAHDGEAAETDAGLFLVGHGVHAETCGMRAGRGDAGERDTRDRADILRARPFGATRGRWEPPGAREAPRQGKDGGWGGRRTGGSDGGLRVGAGGPPERAERRSGESGDGRSSRDAEHHSAGRARAGGPDESIEGRREVEPEGEK